MYNQNTAVFKSAIIFTHRSNRHPVWRECATGAPPAAAAVARIAHPAPSPRPLRGARYAPREHSRMGSRHSLLHLSRYAPNPYG